MKLEELNPEQSITIQVNINSEQLEFPTKILEVLPKKHAICLAPILRKNKVVSFHSGAVLTNLVVAFPDSKPHIFQNVEIETYKQDNNSYYYYISSITPSQQFNRRGAFRCFIGLPAVVQIGLEKHTQEATIKDISNTGFSILPYDSTVEYEIGTTIHLMLDDLVDENKEKYNFYLIGIVVRKHELENGNIVYGCRLNNKVPGLDSYIMLKERLRLSKSRNYN